MESTGRACVCAIISALIGLAIGSGTEEQYEHRYIHGHPLMAGTGVRGAHLNGYVNYPPQHSGERRYPSPPKYPEYHHSDYKNIHDYHQGYPPYQGYPHPHPPYQGYSSEERYQEYPHYHPHPQHERLPHHNHGYPPPPPHTGAYPPHPQGYPYGFHPHHGYYSGENYPSTVNSEEERFTLKATDTEVHLSKPKDKVLYISDKVEKIDSVEPVVKEHSKRNKDEKNEEQMVKDDSGEEQKDETITEEEVIDPRVTKDYSGYSSGYSPIAPQALDNTFCRGLADGNFANPGLTRDADPRCTYITCAGQRPIIFNCAPGTFNGRHVNYHVPMWDSSNPDYQGAPHHRFEAYGKDLCGQLDVGKDGQNPVCSGISIASSEISEEKQSEKKQKPEEYSDIYSIEPASSKKETNKNVKDNYKDPEAKNFAVDADTSSSRDSSAENGDVTENVSDDVSDKVKDDVSKGEAEVKINGELKFVPDFVHPEPEISPPEPESVPAPDIIARPPEGKSLKEEVKSSVLSDYAEYKHGYGMGPTVLDLDFCVNMKDGNYANPGLTLDADPRCTYITCSAERAYIFNCPLGTFNGNDYQHHFPLWGSDVTTYARAHHYHYGKKDVCGAEDKIGMCSR